MKSPASSLLLLLATTGAAKCGPADPATPKLTHLLTAKVTASEGVPIGDSIIGNRTAFPITGGTFTGLISGKLLPVGADFSIIRPNGKFSPDGIAVLQTDDGANILFRDQGYESKDGYIYGAVTFETGAEKYQWLNYVVAVSSAKVSTGASGADVGLEIYFLGPAGP
ncbi:hypothetical protein VHEMI01228 [[Torrubiella] hemipterigena]|uniref:Uncharacterized protein n=1 Tax=[Torrubiella] hemipterigena TaxID=1531966 RepID=A0A0A1T6W7_9HYPO|nr:hypothetical protein VHEMI01228 [[Torrubiella] hemipterigena]